MKKRAAGVVLGLNLSYSEARSSEMALARLGPRASFQTASSLASENEYQAGSRRFSGLIRVEGGQVKQIKKVTKNCRSYSFRLGTTRVEGLSAGFC